MVILDCWKHTIFIKEKPPGDRIRFLPSIHSNNYDHFCASRIRRAPTPPNCQCSCHQNSGQQYHHNLNLHRKSPKDYYHYSTLSTSHFSGADTTSDGHHHFYSTVFKINQNRLHKPYPRSTNNGEKNRRSYSYEDDDDRSDRYSGSCLNHHHYCQHHQYHHPSTIPEDFSQYSSSYIDDNAGSKYNYYQRSYSQDVYRDLKRGGSRQSTKPNILHLIRVDPFKFAAMEPLTVDNRLIVFSLVDTFTRLSPNKLLENYVKKLIQDEGQTSISIFNLSEPLKYLKNDLTNVPIYEYGWPEKRSPSLEKLCSLCKSLDSWLNLDPHNNIAIIYSKRDLSRASLCIAVFLQYIRICFGINGTFFDWESMYNYYHYNLESFLYPSQRRYIDYFQSLLNGDTKINNQRFQLKQVVVKKIPNFDGNGTCKPFMKIYQGLKLVYSSQILNIDQNFLKHWDYIVFNIQSSLKLKGEILVKFYHKIITPSSRTEMFSFQFHTGVLTKNCLIFNKKELDIVLPDKRFHEDTQVKLVFNDHPPEPIQQVALIDDDYQITKCNSYENFFTDANLEYTKGPLDGSLYATVSKKLPISDTTDTVDAVGTSLTGISTTAESPKLISSKIEHPPPNKNMDETVLDELINEIFSEIQSFPDASIMTIPKPSSTEDVYDYVSVRKSPNHNSEIVLQEKENVDPIDDFNEQHSMISEVSALDNLDWLQKQQLKLKLKQNHKDFVEKRLIEELKHTIHNGRHNHYQQAPEIPARKSSRNILTGIMATTASDYHHLPTIYDNDHNDDQSNFQPVDGIVCNSSADSMTKQPMYQNYDEIDSSKPNSSSLMVRSSTPAFPVRHAKLKQQQNNDTKHGSNNVPLFIKDTSAFWYKPHISREEAVRYLSDKPAGYFIIRNSNSFPNAYGLAVKVCCDQNDPSKTDAVRHFLIESTNKGVQIKGCPEEPVFSSLAALVYQHSITRISLPVVLIIPSSDDIDTGNDAYLKRFYENGAACNVIYFITQDVESLTGPMAIKKVVDQLFDKQQQQLKTIKPAVIHFKASIKGITLTDNSHRIFFRQHYPLKSISFCSMDPESRWWLYNSDQTRLKSYLFGFVSQKKNCNQENVCLIFGQYEPDQPSHAIVDFVNKLIMNS